MAIFFRDFVSGALPNPDPYHRAPGVLRTNDILLSATRAFSLKLQADGNLVLSAIEDSTLPPDITQGQYTRALWATGSQGRGATQCRMQADGNVVLYTNSNVAVWASNTNGHPGAFLRCQDDGNIVIQSADGVPFWASQTNVQAHGKSTMGVALGPPPPPPPPPPALQADIDFGAYSANGTPGTVSGSGFTNPCKVSTPAVGFLHGPGGPCAPFTSTGDITTGVLLNTPVMNNGQTINITVTSTIDPNQTLTFSKTYNMP